MCIYELKIDSDSFVCISSGAASPRRHCTCVRGVNPEAFVPKTTQEDEAIVGRDDEAL